LAEAITIGFFVLLGVTGFQVVQILEGSTLVSLPSISVQFTQSVIPIGAAMFILAQLLRLPDVIRAAKGAGFVDHELEEAGVLADDVRSDDPPAMPEGQMPRRTP
ncbi:MAG: hypothetical protein VX259_12905, partial [Pseudomonadota bacterium]|nr:hypothetical protein [Pseudomonadota bacterium]